MTRSSHIVNHGVLGDIYWGHVALLQVQHVRLPLCTQVVWQ